MVDSRTIRNGNEVRRFRQCSNCGRRFKTFEKVETFPLYVLKKDGTRQKFSKEKLISSMQKACSKREISFSSLERIADEIENSFSVQNTEEIQSFMIGESVMEALKELDKVSYIRYAAVYREFGDIESLMDEVKSLLKNNETG